ncbi:MAG TPA: DUF6600 domain-containing protein [Vicinamibacterales bacterium]|nr:DUF6600 domain-containing protein [Vicinamibacterales bacterium]
MSWLPCTLSGRRFPRSCRVAAALAIGSALVAVQARAQDAVVVEPAAQVSLAEPPAHVSLVEGNVVLERDGRADTSPGSMPLLAGDRLRTRDGRAEVLFADGSTLHLDAGTTVDFQSDDVLRLLEGRIRLHIVGTARDVAYRIDAPAGWVSIEQPGAYRVSLLRDSPDPEVELAVVRGAAELVNEDGRTMLRAGERALARVGLAPSVPYVFNSAAWDEFDQWSEALRGNRLGTTAEYLPQEVQPYAATLVNYGTWGHEPTYGYVWYPRVHSGWRPYYYGRWARLRPWGWTWIAADPWGWPTHHYGRWGFSAGVWFWIPGKHWGPAWVSWGYAPGYVSWCPLGWNNRPLFHFSATYFGGKRYSPWHGWTVVPHRRFGRGFVNVNVVNAANIDARTRGAFAVRTAGPNVQGYAVPRSSAPIRVAGVGRPGAGGGAPAFSRAPSRTAPEGAAALRSRRPAGEPLTGPGLPAPARSPRASSGIRTAPSGSSGTARSRVPAAPSGEGGAVRRAEPRSGVPVAPSRNVEPSPRTAPPVRTTEPQSRRQAPGYRAAPAPARPDRPAASPYDAPSRSRVVPRGAERARPAEPPSAMPPDSGRRATPEYGRRGSDSAPGVVAPRAVPRSMPDSQGRSYPSSPALERRGSPSGSSRPAGPPAGAAPSRPSGPSRPAGPPAGAASSRPSGPPPAAASPSPRGGGGSEGGSRSRGGQPSRGSAVRRGSGG